MRYAHLGEEGLERVRRRSRWAALLPTASVRARQTDRDDTGFHLDDLGNRTLLVGGGRDRGFEIDLQWRLDQLAMGPTQIAALGETARLAERRAALLERVTRAYFERERLVAEPPPGDDAAQTEHRIAIEERTAELDALTGGWFGERTERAQARAR